MKGAVTTVIITGVTAPFVRQSKKSSAIETISPNEAKTRYIYDKHDELTGVAEPVGNVTSYEVGLKRMVTNVYQYDPYGQVTYGSTKHTDFYGYNAESYNPNTGLEYLRARYYNAESGRFFQKDTYLGDLWEPLTLNQYAYVGNSPLNYVDPTGHRSVSNPLGNTLIQTPDAGKIKIDVPDWSSGILGGGSGTSEGGSYLSSNTQWREVIRNRPAIKREENESFMQWKMQVAEASGIPLSCSPRELVQMMLNQKGIDPSQELSGLDKWLFPGGVAPEIRERVNQYLARLYDSASVPNTNEVKQIRLTVDNILADAIWGGYQASDISDIYINTVFGYYLAERVEYADRSVIIMEATATEAVRKAIQGAGKGEAATGDEGGSGTGETTTLFRSVGADEYLDIMDTQQFNIPERGMQSKQFGFNAEETLKFADWDKRAVAVIEVKIPTETLNNIGDFTPVDPGIFKSGNVTIHSDVLDIFNQFKFGISEKY